MATLLIAEQSEGTLLEPTARCLTAACSLNAPVHVFVYGRGAEKAAAAAGLLQGVEKVLVASGPDFDHGLSETVSAALAQFRDDYAAYIAPATSNGKNIMPRLAAKFDVMQLSEVIAVLSADTFDRPIYAGSAIQTVQSHDPIKVITVRSSAFSPAGEQAVAAPVETVALALPVTVSTTFKDEAMTASDRPDLTSAKVVISGGRAMASRENFDTLISPIADRLNAAIGASRAAVDAGYAPNDWQVGQTGKIVAPELYIAVGISGAIQHLAGMQDSRVIVAINKDEDAPIFRVADIGLVGDLYQVLPALDAELAERAN